MCQVCDDPTRNWTQPRPIKETTCLRSYGGYGACLEPIGHDGLCRDAFGYRFVGLKSA